MINHFKTYKMKDFYEGGRGLCLPDQYVETQNFASLRRRKRRSKHTSAVQRGEAGIPRSVQMYLQIFLFNMRRGEKCFALTTMILCFMLFSSVARPQPRGKLGTATGQTARQIKDTTDTILAIEEVIVSTGYQQIPRERATGAFEVVDSSLFHRRIGPDVIDRLENIVPGVVFDCIPGALDTLLVRGRSTIFAPSPAPKLRPNTS